MSIYNTGPLLIMEATTFSPSISLSSTADANFPLSNISDRNHPLRSYRTSHDPGTTQTMITIDLGASPPRVNALFLDNTNLAYWSVQHSTNGASFSTWSDGFTTSLDALTGRGRAFLDVSSVGSANYRYLRLLAPAQTPLRAPLDKAMLGSITVGITGNILQFPGGLPTEFEVTTNLPVLSNEFQGGAVEYVEIGERYVEIDIPTQQYVRSTQEASILEILNLNTTPFVFYENNGDINRAYLVRSKNYKNNITYSIGAVLGTSLEFKEVS